jgi:hypothetical protein
MNPADRRETLQILEGTGLPWFLASRKTIIRSHRHDHQLNCCFAYFLAPFTGHHTQFSGTVSLAGVRHGNEKLAFPPQ